ncbi:MAG: hypothetical protein J6S51_06130 [Kiritimatiellae bacterium]|nr:hypothetical protein [Kiritimatiellia bacterium]
MKKLLFVAVLFSAAISYAALDPTYVDPNPYADYKVAMASVSNNPMAVEWHAANRAELDLIDDAWCKGVFAGGEASLMKHLDAVKGAYISEPLELTRIAALTQYAMKAKSPWWTFGFAKSKERVLLTNLFLKKASDPKDTYIQMFFIDQLRWVAFPEQALEVKKIGEKSSDKGVKSIADMAWREISK